ncbi:STAS domain-containing protein [Maridesulfovibrio hydrothermalis]|uniref:Anti-sigma factor antagonist n=1 Tax=Maridesulfovibrio hydrothermalis AM13 = DSM 14728 TaxID=1121451 RepID=L0R7E7_9BACT|nr:STAS domain-containing protein [Maridesulfovibrio hydrothermalis]CCO22653.1 Stage II sporulation protein [Maridesulfovibrio hydrothermalis AM13 = DSM 14728]
MAEERIKISDGILTLKCGKEVTIETIYEFKSKIEKDSESADVNIIVADLSEAQFLDSSGIGFLVSLNSRLKSLNKNMYLLKPSEQICKTLELVRLISFFNIIEDERELP